MAPSYINLVTLFTGYSFVCHIPSGTCDPQTGKLPLIGNNSDIRGGYFVIRESLLFKIQCPQSRSESSDCIKSQFHLSKARGKNRRGDMYSLRYPVFIVTFVLASKAVAFAAEGSVAMGAVVRSAAAKIDAKSPWQRGQQHARGLQTSQTLKNKAFHQLAELGREMLATQHSMRCNIVGMGLAWGEHSLCAELRPRGPCLFTRTALAMTARSTRQWPTTGAAGAWRSTPA